MMLSEELMRDDADNFSQQLLLLQDALRQAGGHAPIYKETRSPNCSPTRSAIN